MYGLPVPVFFNLETWRTNPSNSWRRSDTGLWKLMVRYEPRMQPGLQALIRNHSQNLLEVCQQLLVQMSTQEKALLKRSSATLVGLKKGCHTQKSCNAVGFGFAFRLARDQVVKTLRTNRKLFWAMAGLRISSQKQRRDSSFGPLSLTWKLRITGRSSTSK